MDALTEKRKEDGLAPRRIDDLINTKGFQEKMCALIKRLNINDFCTAKKLAVQNEQLIINKLTYLKKNNPFKLINLWCTNRTQQIEKKFKHIFFHDDKKRI